jgi:uncharacterized protein (TIGR02271 family)
MLPMRRHVIWKAQAFQHRRSAGTDQKALWSVGLSKERRKRQLRQAVAFGRGCLAKSLVPKQRAAYLGHDEWYDRRAQAGNAVLDVMVHEDAQIRQAVTILESHHPIEIEEDTEEGASPSSSVGSTADVLVSSPSPVIGSTHPGSPAVGAGDAMAAASASGKEEVIPLVEENIEIGKRTIDRGTTRVRRYVVETPIERDVTLHGERVTIERRQPIDPAVTGHAFEERTVEVQETEEVPVIEKTARVVEEVAIRKEETERTETVRDSVRRDDIEVSGRDG